MAFFRRLEITLVTFLWGVTLFSQTNGYVWADSLNTAKDAGYMTDAEKAVIFEMNKVRTNPKAYAAYLEDQRKYYTKNKRIVIPGKRPLITKEGVKALNECIVFLKKAKPAGILHPSKALYKAALDLASNQSVTGNRGHVGSDGSDMADRIRRYVAHYSALGENITYGRENQAQGIVFQLLIDDGVPDRGHRQNIMRAIFTRCGVSIAPHKMGFVCVIDYEQPV